MSAEFQKHRPQKKIEEKISSDKPQEPPKDRKPECQKKHITNDGKRKK